MTIRIGIRLPALRERRDDILPLTHLFIRGCSAHFHKKISGIAPEAVRALMGYPWPGNLRELENAIEHAVSFAQGEIITVDDLPSFILEGADGKEMVTQALEKQHTVAQLERATLVGFWTRPAGTS